MLDVYHTRRRGCLLGVQVSADPRTPGLVNFTTVVAYHFCLNLPRAFSQPRACGLADPCRLRKREQGQASSRSIRTHTLSLVYVHVQIERSKIVPYKDQADEVQS